MEADGTVLPNKDAGKGHKITCRFNRSSTSKVFVVDKTSVVETAGLMKALKRAFPSDGFALFRAVAFGVLKDKWVVAVDQPPKTTTKQLVFSGTEVGEKGHGVHLSLWQMIIVYFVGQAGMRRLQVAKMAKSEVYCQLPPSVNVNGVIDRNRFRYTPMEFQY